jgi:hypothetical protein
MNLWTGSVDELYNYLAEKIEKEDDDKVEKVLDEFMDRAIKAETEEDDDEVDTDDEEDENEDVDVTEDDEEDDETSSEEP